jgi:UDP-N-acetylmuramoyl-tripeptide--D-alanyl-D-alanine ligase
MTPLWTEADLVAATGGRADPFAATGVSIDTRTIAPGELFVALVGETGDGHDHVADALAKGASGVMVHRDCPGPTLRVRDTLAGLHAMGAFARARFGGRVLAVTGSVGKTTTKEMLRALLSPLGATHAAVASYNNHWGVPLTLARMPPAARFAVVEIGTNHPGEIAPLSRMARPHVGLITAVERAHVGHFAGIEAIAEEKGSIAQGLEPDGTMILPAGSPHLGRLEAQAARKHILRFGSEDRADGRLIAVRADAEGSEVTMSLHGRRMEFRIGAPGVHMAMNGVAAILAADALAGGAPIDVGALAQFAPVSGRGTRRVVAVPDGEALLLDESYNASGSAVAAALDVLGLQPARRRIAVLGDMLELGEEGPAEHLRLVPHIYRSADLLFACGPLMKLAYDAMPAEKRGGYADNSRALVPLVAASVRDGDAVLVKGSLGTRMKPIVDMLARSAERP